MFKKNFKISTRMDDETIAEVIAESQREKQVIRADDDTNCAKEVSSLSLESLKRGTKQLNKKVFCKRFNLIVGRIISLFKFLTPYMSYGAVVLCLLNLIYLANIQSDIKNLKSSIENLDIDNDNSDVINAIEDAEGNIIGTVEDTEGNIIGTVEDAERKIKSDIFFWSNR